jgi:outer membrane protein TolC
MSRSIQVATCLWSLFLVAPTGLAQESQGSEAPTETAGEEPTAPATPEESFVEAPLDSLDVSTAKAFVQKELFGEGRALELTIDAALAIAETNNLGLQIEDVSSEVARFNAFGSWGSFDWVFQARGQLVDGEQKGSSQLSGASVLQFDQQGYDLSFTRPLETGGSFSATFDTTNTKTNNQFTLENPSTTDNLKLTYTQPLLRGFGKDYATSVQQEAEVAYRRQLERRREILQKLLRDVYNAYWDLVQTRQQLEVAGSSLDLGLEQLERNRRMLEAGVGTDVEVIQAEAEVAKRIETLLKADVAVRNASDALKILLFPGKDVATWETELIPVTELPEEVSGEVAPWAQLLDVATEYRAELRQQRYEIEAAKLRHERALSEKRIGLDLDLSVNSQGFSGEWQTAAKEAFGFDFPTYTAGITVNTPIGNRTASYAERAARAQLRAAFLTYEQVETQVAGEVRDAVRQVRYQAEAVNAAQKSLEAAQRQLAAEEARYRNDLSTNFQLLEFQLRLVEAMNSEQTARVNYVKALYQLESSQGVLGEPKR